MNQSLKEELANEREKSTHERRLSKQRADEERLAREKMTKMAAMGAALLFGLVVLITMWAVSLSDSAMLTRKEHTAIKVEPGRPGVGGMTNDDKMVSHFCRIHRGLDEAEKGHDRNHDLHHRQLSLLEHLGIDASRAPLSAEPAAAEPGWHRALLGDFLPSRGQIGNIHQASGGGGTLEVVDECAPGFVQEDAHHKNTRKDKQTDESYDETGSADETADPVMSVHYHSSRVKDAVTAAPVQAAVGRYLAAAAAAAAAAKDGGGGRKTNKQLRMEHMAGLVVEAVGALSDADGEGWRVYAGVFMPALGWRRVYSTGGWRWIKEDKMQLGHGLGELCGWDE